MRFSSGYSRVLLRPQPVHLAILFVGTIVTGFICGVHRQPIYTDSGWFLYASQAAHRGEPLYSSVYYGYTPYGPLVGALSIHVGRLLAVPSYLAPRYLNLLAHALCPCALYLVSTRAMPRSSSRAFLAGATLAGFGLQTALSVSRLNPKTWVILCSLLCALFVLRGNWTLAGLCASVASLFWQPAVVCVAAAGFFVMASDAGRRRRAIRRFTTGLLIGAAPCVAYLTVKGEWGPFWLSAVSGQFAADPDVGVFRFLRWLTMPIAFWTEAPVFVVAFFSFIAYHANAIRETGVVGIRRDPMAVLTAFTVAYAVVVMLNFDGAAHAGPLLQFIACWAVVYSPKAFRKAGAALGRALPTRRPWSELATGAPIALALVLLFADTPVFAPRFTLEDQRALLRRVTQDGELGFLAINAPEFYVLTEASSPIPYVRFYPRIDWLAEARGFDAFVATVAKALQPVVILPQPRSGRSALRSLLSERILRDLPSTAYQQPGTHPGAREFVTGVPAVRSYVVYNLSPGAMQAKRDEIHRASREQRR